VCIGLVNGYANTQLPNAFRPVVDGTVQALISAHIASRVSAQTRLNVVNLKHQVVTVIATMLVASSADVGTMKENINQMLKVYFSPWISSNTPQASLGRCIIRSALIGFLAAQKGVLSVKNLDLAGGETLADDATIFVSAMTHNLMFEVAEAVHG